MTSRTLRIEFTLRSLFVALAVAAGIWLASRLAPILLTILIAFVLAGTLSPAVEALERRRVPRAWGVALVASGLVIVTSLLALLTVPALLHQLGEGLRTAPALQERAAEQLARRGLTAPLAASVRAMRISSLSNSLSGHLFEYSSRAAVMVAYTVTTIVLALYMLADRDRVRGMAYALVPRAYHLRLSRILLNFETIVGGYMRGQVITSACMMVFAFILLTLCRVPGALSLAVFAGLADVLPFVGGLLALAPVLLAASARGPFVALCAVAAMITYQELENRLLIPWVYGRVLRLPPVVIVVALLAGGELLGMMGALLALPMAAAVRMILEELRVALPGDSASEGAVLARDAQAEREFEERTAGAPAMEAAAVAMELADVLLHAEPANGADDPQVTRNEETDNAAAE